MPYFRPQDVPDCDDLNRVAFVLGVSLDDVDVVLRTLEQGADVETNCAEYGDGNSLVLAAEEGALKVARVLLDAGVVRDVAAMNRAAVRVNFEFVRLLLDFGMTPTHDTLVAVSDETMLETLIAAGAPINPAAQAGYSPALHLAVAMADFKLVALLLKLGVNPNFQDAEGRTVLMTAVEMEGPSTASIVDRLLAAGGCKSLSNRDGLTAYDIAMSTGLHADLVALLAP